MKRYVIIWVSISIFVIIVLTIFTNWILSEEAIIPVTHGNDWLGYWSSIVGGIIGGIITFIGLHVTIRHERKMNRESSRLQVMPYLDYKFIAATSEDKDEKHRIQGICSIFFSKYRDKENDNNFFYLQLINIGNGIALDINLSKIVIEENLENDNKLTNENILRFRNIYSLRQDECAAWLLLFTAPDKEDLDINIRNSFFNVNFKMQSYKDILENYYEQIISCVYDIGSIHYDEEKKERFYQSADTFINKIENPIIQYNI